MKGKGVERAKEKLKLKTEKAYVHICVYPYTQAHTLSQSPRHTCSHSHPSRLILRQLFSCF